MTPVGRRTTYDEMMDTASSRGRVRSLWSEVCPPFTIQANVKIPDLTDERREERHERQLNLQKRPKHKEVKYLSDVNSHQFHSDKLMSAPLTM